jgi:ABC-2 type transport system permease protein
MGGGRHSAMGILYGGAVRRGSSLATFLPLRRRRAADLVLRVNGCILEGSEVFIANEGLIRFLPGAAEPAHLPAGVAAVAVLPAQPGGVGRADRSIFPQPLSWTLLLAIPAFLLLVLNGAWISVLTGIIATRFRDIPPIIASLSQLLFFMTPIVWQYDTLLKNPAVAERARIAELNPVMHFVEILRQPMLGQEIAWPALATSRARSRWSGWAAALVCLRNYRSRVAYWV